MKAQAIFDQYSKTVPSESLNRTALFITVAAQRNSPTTPTGRIDSELSVEMVPRIGKRGQPLSTRSAKNRNYRGLLGGRSVVAGVPFSVLIVGARANPESNLNLNFHGGRYAIAGGHPFKGAKRSQFRQIMNDRISRMVKRRHSTGTFFKQAWGAIVQKLIPHVPSKYRGGFGKLGMKTKEFMGSVSPAMPGVYACSCTIELNIGMDGAFQPLADDRNEAMHKHLGPVLQSAIDQEFLSKLELAAKNGWLERGPALSACGFTLGV